MNLNHEIITFKDVDILSSKIYMRMMLRGEKNIKKYKQINLKLNELCKNNKEKKIMNFPYRSKLVFNYNLTNDKNKIAQFINEVKYNRDYKKGKSIFESNEDDDENCEEESEDSTKEKEEKKDSNKSINRMKTNENKDIAKAKTNNINNRDNKILSFRQRLSFFEKKENVPKINTITKPEIKINKINNAENNKNKEFQLKIQQMQNLINNKRKATQTMKNPNNQNTPDDYNKNIINSNNHEILKNENIIKKEEIKINEEDYNNSDKNAIKENSNIDNHGIKIEKEINNNVNNNNNIIPKINRGPKKNTTIEKNPLELKSKILQEKNDDDINLNNINSDQNLTQHKINIYKEQNLESFCNSFFICSFPYKNGKIIENSKNYRSSCNHPPCSRLISMEPEIIFKYPPNDINDLELNNLSASICFPTGIKICYNQERRNIYKPFSTHIISKQGKKYYMVIYHFYRKLDSMTYNQLYFDNPLKLYLRQFGDNTFRNKVEQEQLEKELAECQDLGFKDFVFIPYSMVLISKYPYINQMKTCLNIIYKIMINEKEILNNINENKTKNLIKELLSYLIYSIPIPTINNEISFNLPLISEKLKLSSPYKDKIRDLEITNFTYIISKFCPENIIDIYRFMLFEQKILFINKDYNSITSVIDSFINILYPVDWINTIIPIMSCPMVRYLQTFLPFINGISEDLFENSAKQTLEEAEEGVFEIFIFNDTIKFSKPDYEDDIKSSIPKLPKDIHNKLYSELSDLAEVYKNFNDKEKEKYEENVNSIAKNIFFESTCIMLYDLVDIMIEEQKEFNGFSNSTLNKIYEKDASFYKELTETQIFQNFVNNFIQRKKDYTSFICMLKNISEKYVKSDLSNIKGKKKWKKTTRKISKREVQYFPVSFKIPRHLLNPEKINNYIINNKEWNEINKEIKQNYQGNEDILQNKIVPESERSSSKIIEINSELKILNQEVYRYIIPNESNDKNKARHSFSIILNNPLLLNKNNIESKIKVDTDLSKSLKEKIKNDLSSLLNSILSNKNYEKEKFNDEKILSYVYYDIGKEVLSKALYKKGFRVAFKLNEYNYIYLCKICLTALISLCDSEENIINIEFAVKIISSAFYYSKENSNEYLIDDLRDNLGKNFYFWNKESFWNTWQIMENYFSLTDYSTYCRIIMHDFANKLLRIKLDKEFIINYLISSLGEKLILLEHNNDLNQNAIQENQTLFSENRIKIMEIINNCTY